MGPLTNAVDVPGHNVPAEPVMGTQGFFQVDRAFKVQPSGFVQRFGRDIHRERVVLNIKRGHGHARAIDGNAVAQRNVVQV